MQIKPTNAGQATHEDSQGIREPPDGTWYNSYYRGRIVNVVRRAIPHVCPERCFSAIPEIKEP